MHPILRRLRADFRRSYPLLARRLDLFELRATFKEHAWKVTVDYGVRIIEVTIPPRRPSETEWARLLVGMACTAVSAHPNIHNPLCRFVRGTGAKMYVEKLATNIAVAYMLQQKHGVSIREFDAEFFLAEDYGMELKESLGRAMSLREIRRQFVVREFAKRMDRQKPHSVVYDSRNHPIAVREWVFEHLGERAWWPPTGFVWSFLRVEDAVAFRLRWSGEEEDEAA